MDDLQRRLHRCCGAIEMSRADYYPIDKFSADYSRQLVEHELERRRPKAIEGETMTEIEKAAYDAEKKRLALEQREAQIRTTQKDHAVTCRKKQRVLDKAQKDWRLAKVALACSAGLTPLLIGGWLGAISWGVATSFTGGRGGVVAFYIVALLVLTIGDVLSLFGTIPWAYKKHEGVTDAEHARNDAVLESADYDIAIEAERAARPV
jgi:hypothetical protein